MMSYHQDVSSTNLASRLQQRKASNCCEIAVKIFISTYSGNFLMQCMIRLMLLTWTHGVNISFLIQKTWQHLLYLSYKT